jgi:hypothetical protein
MGMNRSQRFALFLAALEEAPAARDQASARALLEDIMNRIEEAHSGVPFDPEKWMTDGRMYPLLDDQERDSRIAGTSLFYSFKHNIWLGGNGAIRIERRLPPNPGLVELDKPGHNGALCPKPK